MIKVCVKCRREFQPDERKCPVCGEKLRRAYTEEEAEKMKKEEEDTMDVLSNMWFM